MGRFAERSFGVHLALLVLLLGAITVAFLGVLDFYGVLSGWPKTVVEHLTVCPYSAVTGRPCPLCGTVRAMVLLVSGEAAASLSVNPLAAALLPTGLLQLAYRGVRVFRPAFRWKEEAALAGLGGVTALVVMGARMM